MQIYSGNGYFERIKKDTRIDRRSYKRQVIAQIPTFRLGVAAAQIVFDISRKRA